MSTKTMVEIILNAMGIALVGDTGIPIVFRVLIGSSTQTSHSSWGDLPRLTGEIQEKTRKSER